MATLQEVAMIIAKLSAAFPSWKPNQFTIEVYHEDLQDIPADELYSASKACRMQKGREFAPTIGEIRGMWEEIQEAKPRTPRLSQSEGEPVYVPMPQYLKDQLNEFFKKKGVRSKYRDSFQQEANRMEKIK